MKVRFFGGRMDGRVQDGTPARSCIVPHYDPRGGGWVKETYVQSGYDRSVEPPEWHYTFESERDITQEMHEARERLHRQTLDMIMGDDD